MVLQYCKAGNKLITALRLITVNCTISFFLYWDVSKHTIKCNFQNVLMQIFIPCTKPNLVGWYMHAMALYSTLN